MAASGGDDAGGVGGWVILQDRENRYFPRWLGYYNLWAALIFTPGTFNMFFHHGPLAWNGFIVFWIPVPSSCPG